jgi:hypothetical protein
MYFVLVMTPRGKGRSHTLLNRLVSTWLALSNVLSSLSPAQVGTVYCSDVRYAFVQLFAFAHLCDDDDSGKDCVLANIYRYHTPYTI